MRFFTDNPLRVLIDKYLRGALVGVGVDFDGPENMEKKSNERNHNFSE